MNLLNKTLITIAVLLFFSGLIFVFVIQPTISDIRAFNDRIQIERVALENKYTSRRNIKNIIADLNLITKQLEPLNKNMMIEQGGEISFIQSLEKIAESNNLVQKISIKPVTKENNGKIALRYNITVELSGNYLDVLKYLNNLEQEKFYINFYGATISNGNTTHSKTASSGSVKTNLQGYVYFSI